ncbi:kynurenine formamidase [Venturia canescens]|uniref:kynurenine formamidase n=1 Tax=Venturia canescens TaxID=32260 RepID=UPI001C9C5E57|nr:kynurenine formamidase [Venturia canescens]XP_043275782.1 kynurenine formamidase [Venturia canescens]XP_043275783.1 kynurenine formamidase [Venturia canescens]
MSIDPEYEKMYSPSAWCKRVSGPKVLELFSQLGEKVTNKIRSTLSCELDIPYGIGDRAKYDVYGTNLPNDAPILVFIHGGYWQELSKELASFHVESFVSKGIKAYNVGYSLCPTVTLTEIISEIKSAVEKILKQACDLGSKCVWIAGHSAGAHMAASLLHDTEWLNSIKRNASLKLIKGIVLISGIYKLEPLLRTSYNEALKLSRNEIESLSFGSLETSRYEPIRDIKVLVTVGECDPPKFVQQSRDYAQKLIEFVDNVEFKLLRNSIDHFEIVENLGDKDFVLTKMILQMILEH